MRNLSLKAAFTVGLFGLTFFAGCEKPANKQSTTSEKAENSAPTIKYKGTIGVSILRLDNPFFKVIADNITESAGKQGYKVTVVSADTDLLRQSNQVKDFIVQGVSAIVMCPCDAKGGVKIATQICTDNYGGGKEAGRAMIEALGEEGGEVLVLDLKRIESCLLRVAGFKEVIDAHNASSKSKIDIVTELNSEGAKDVSFKSTEDALQAHPNIRGVFAINDPAALGARAALEKAGKAAQVKIVGFDGQPEGKQAIKEGKIYADPIQFPDKMGIQIAASIVKHFKGEELPPQVLIPTKLYRIEDAKNDPELK